VNLPSSKTLKEFLRRWAPQALLLTGAVLLVYVTFEYGSMYVRQKQLSAQWERQNAPSAAAPPKAQDPREQMTRLSIPSIDLDAIVVEGTSTRQLAIAPGHMTDTAAPGESGNSVITAHRDTFFRSLRKIRPGDVVTFDVPGREFRYEVESTLVVSPNEVGVLHPSSTSRELTLITCYPFDYIGPAPDRFVVRAREIGTASPEQRARTASSRP